MKKPITLFGLILCFIHYLPAQETTINLKLDDALRLARTQSLQTFLNKHYYMSDYWAHRSFEANYLPSVDLSANPVRYSNASRLRYNSNTQSDEYIRTENITSDASLNISQKLAATGGTFFVESELMRVENFGDNQYIQFSSVPVSLGYSQELFGFNPMKWQRKIEPLKFEKAKKDYVKSVEEMHVSTVNYFFALARQQMRTDIAQTNLENSSRLLDVAKQRHELGTVTREELLDLRLSQNNANIAVQEAKIDFREARERLLNFLMLPVDIEIKVTLPEDITLEQVEAALVLEKALENNPELLALEQNILESKRNVASAKADRHFQANLNVSYGISKTDGNGLGNGSLENVYNPDFDNHQLVSVGLNIPILDWGDRKGQYHMAKSQQQVAEVSARKSRQEFEQQALTRAMAFNILKSKLESAALSDTLAAESYELTMTRFMTGKADVLKLTTSQNAKDNAQLQYLNAMAEYWRSYYNLRSLALFDFENNEDLTFDEEELGEL